VTRVVCLGTDPAASELAAELGEAPGIEGAGVYDDIGTAPDADVAVVCDRDPDAARVLTRAALERGAAVVMLAAPPDWQDDEALRESAHRAGLPVLGYVAGDGAFAAELVPALLALACIRVDRLEVDHSHHEVPRTLIRIQGEPSFEVELTGDVGGPRAVAALTVNAIPRLLAAPTGLYAPADLPVIAARRAPLSESIP
jgi:hypothetical protein